METYVVGFNIFDARGLVTPDGNPCDPFILVECCGKEYETETKIGKQSIVSYNENFIWSDIQLYPEQFKAANITFSIFSRNWFSRNDLIGRATLQLANVRMRRNHVYAKKWVNAAKDNEPTPSGAISLTVFCLAPGDTAPSVDQQEGNDEGDEAAAAGGARADDYEDLTKAVLGGTIDQSGGMPHHVLVTIHRVEDLAAGSNPFVTCEFAGSLVHTSTAKNVEQHTFNECISIPAKTPLFEDILVVKLWNHFYMSADELFAQGMLSFSELRNKPMLPRWFNFYGYNPDEIQDHDVKAIAEQGEDVEPNWYKGKLLISARVEKLDSIEDLQPAGLVAAQRFEEPASTRVCLLIDVYMVAGAVGRECQVEVTLGTQVVDTEWVYPALDEGKASSLSKKDSSHEEVQDFELPTTFHYNQKQGRPAVIAALMPEDPISQPDCIVNVYTRGVMSGRIRLGYAKIKLSHIGGYDPGNPVIPTFFPLKPMPWNGVQRLPVSLLMTLEKTSDESVTNSRHNRKQVKNMQYVLRTYIFGAKSIDFGGRTDDPNLFVRVTCAGASLETERIPGDLRPNWMRCIELNITLMTDHPKKAPTMEPITVSLCNHDGYLSQPCIGKSICKYTYMRTKNILDDWEPFTLSPQWVKLYGGQYNTKSVGSVCIAFELLRKKDVPQLPPARMWPKDELMYQPSVDFCKLRKATLHVSLLGLRDMKPLPAFAGLTTAAMAAPLVEFKVRQLLEHEKVSDKGKVMHKFWRCFASYTERKPGGDPNNPADHNKKWESGGGSNFEFYHYRRFNVMLPEFPVFQPWVTIKVFEQGTFGASEVAECRLPLGPLLPWLESADEWEIAEPVDSFLEMDAEERLKVMHMMRTAELKDKSKMANVIQPPAQTEEEINTSGVHISLRKPAPPHQPFFPIKESHLNMKLGHSHGRIYLGPSEAEKRKYKIPPKDDYFLRATGEIPRAGAGGAGTRGEVEGRLEDSTKGKFKNDFYYRNLPLTRNRDVFEATDMEASFDKGNYGFVKCAIKLTEGHMTEILGDEGLQASSNTSALENPQENDGSTAAPSGSSSARLREDEEGNATGEGISDDNVIVLTKKGEKSRIDPASGRRQSLDIPRELDKYAWDEEAFREKYKDSANLPSRIRTRLYFVKGICIYGKGTGFANPYLEFNLGKTVFVSMRNMFQKNTNTPTFYRLEERDIRMPEDSRLEISLKDYSDFGYDAVIGSTVIDLEDRWHSARWKDLSEKQLIPSENRGLWNGEAAGMSRGSMEMWVEMLDSVKSSEQKATDLRAPPAQEIEIRFVLWDTNSIRIVDDDHTDVHLVCNFDCAEYLGTYPTIQETDVHYGSKTGNAIFNWRIVYPHIMMPTKSATLQISVFDYNLMSGNTFIADVNLDLKKYLEKVAKDMDAIQTNSDLHFKNASVEEENPEVVLGSVNLSMWVMTQSEADAQPVGLGRNEPNVNPQLITPLEGRGWGDVLGGFTFKMPNFGLLGKLMPIIIVCFLLLIGLKYIGLL